MHLNGAHQTREASGFFQRVRQRQTIDHRGEHPHVVARRAIDRQLFLTRASKNIPAAYDDRYLHAQLADRFHFARHALNCFGMNSGIERPLQRLSGEFQYDAFVDGTALLRRRSAFLVIFFHCAMSHPRCRGHFSSVQAIWH
jgi:hypothetical protein